MYNILLLCGSCDIHILYHIITLYTLTIILSIMSKNNEVYLVAFYSRTFIFLKLNYNIHDTKLLAIFKAFKI